MKTVEGTVVTTVTTYVTVEVDDDITVEQLREEMAQESANLQPVIETEIFIDGEEYGDSPTLLTEGDTSLAFSHYSQYPEATLVDGDTSLALFFVPTSYSPEQLGEIEDDENQDAYPLDNRGYGRRVRQLEEAGMTTSDAQGVADAEWDATGGYRFGHRTGN